MGTFDQAFAQADAVTVNAWRSGDRKIELAGRLSSELTHSAAAYLAAKLPPTVIWRGARRVAAFSHTALADGTITVIGPGVLTGELGGRPQAELMMSPLGEPAVVLIIPEGWIDRAISGEPATSANALAQLMSALSIAEFNLHEEHYRATLGRLASPTLDLACDEPASIGLQASLHLFMAGRARNLSRQIRLAA